MMRRLLAIVKRKECNMLFVVALAAYFIVRPQIPDAIASILASQLGQFAQWGLYALSMWYFTICPVGGIVMLLAVFAVYRSPQVVGQVRAQSAFTLMLPGTETSLMEATMPVNQGTIMSSSSSSMSSSVERDSFSVSSGGLFPHCLEEEMVMRTVTNNQKKLILDDGVRFAPATSGSSNVFMASSQTSNPIYTYSAAEPFSFGQ